MTRGVKENVQKIVVNALRGTSRKDVKRVGGLCDFVIFTPE